MTSTEELEALFAAARAAADFAYAPYSHFRVGAALLAAGGAAASANGDAAAGTVFSGCNVENRSYGLTICAERNAVLQGVAKGCRSFTALAISTPDSENPVGPCGACRQVLSEFMQSDAPVFFGGSGPQRVTTTIGELLPHDSLYDLKK